MRALRFVAAEAWHELRAGCRGPLIPLVFAALIAYLLIVMMSSDYLREWGSIDVPRNSPQLVYLMVSGQALTLLFILAWIFGQVVVRDRTARLHEMVLAAPVSLGALLAGRYLGALGLALLLSPAMGLGFLLVPLLGAAGLIPADAVGPQPFFAIAHSLLLFTVPSAVGLGALLLCAAIRTRGIVGPFAVAAAVMLIWMIAMVVIRGGDAHPAVATFLDASGFSAVEEQTDLWTPREKETGVVRLTPPLVINRVTWTFPPLLLLLVVLRRVGRERLALDRRRQHCDGTARQPRRRRRPSMRTPRGQPCPRDPRGHGPPGTKCGGTCHCRSAAGARCSRWEWRRSWGSAVPSCTSSCTPTAPCFPAPI